MNNNRVTIDGKEFSEETVKTVLQKHCNFESDIEPKQIKVDRFRAAKIESSSLNYLIGGVEDEDYEWDGKNQVDNLHAQICLYEESEVEEIIAGLQELLKS